MYYINCVKLLNSLHCGVQLAIIIGIYKYYKQKKRNIKIKENGYWFYDNKMKLVGF